MMNTNPAAPLCPSGGESHELKFKALADKKRLQIVQVLARRGRVCVCDLTDVLDIPQSSLSYHLKILMDANFITRDIHGTWNYYRVNRDAFYEILAPDLCKQLLDGAESE
ncbi:ArsR/SmtB family transcription factor [Alicyclobacillus contaminans]|uniref:ArsR/SmtB family transcription factor n=1 Tax=Alicyclobacillus contaminans TaxID=392016 RepID=UPI00040FBBBD|nr:metalloregulator ArsR/SmtB family transcription factor [Alicyclobacillus contaminans]